MVNETLRSEALFTGGVSIDLGSRHYGLRRVRATIPFGRLKVDGHQVEIQVRRGVFLPLNLPLPVVMSRDSICVFAKKGPIGVGIGFRTESTVHYFWTYRPGRVMQVLQEFGYKTCP